MKSKEVTYSGQSPIAVSLEADVIGLEEVVAIGYGTMKKSDLTGAVSSISSEEITAFPTTNLVQAIQGRTSGVHVMQNSGRPGDTPQIRIRGTNSIKGNNSPLWIINGFPGNPEILDNSDIESMEVLKDASATAIYGSRGANGVIIVTTKQGKAGATKVDYKGSYSSQTIRHKLDLMNAEEFMRKINIQQINDVGKEYFTASDISNAGKGTDWQDEMYRAAPLNDHSVTVSGGSENTQFAIGGNFFDQKGIVLNDDGYQRMSLRASLNHNISKKFSIAYNAILSRINQDIKSDIGIVNHTIMAPPTLKLYEEDGDYTNFLNAYPFSYTGYENPVMIVNERSRISRSNNVMANLELNYKPVEGLSIKVSGNVNTSDSRLDYYQTRNYIGSTGVASISTSRNLQINRDNIIHYEKKFGEDHKFSATGAVTYEEFNSTTLGASGSGFLSDKCETYNI